MADRQGLFKGRHIGEVQHYCASLLLLVQKIDKIKDQDRQLRLALLARPEFDPSKLFPELTTEVVDDDEAEFADDEDAVKYDFSNATYDPKAVEEEIREMMARAAQGAATFESPTYTDWV